jgi:hypothetical protein
LQIAFLHLFAFYYNHLDFGPPTYVALAGFAWAFTPAFISAASEAAKADKRGLRSKRSTPHSRPQSPKEGKME